MSDRADIPSPKATNFEQRVRETLMTYLGRQGNPLDRGLTLRDLIENGLVKIRDGFVLKPGAGSLPLGPGTNVQDAYEPDLTPPPTPTGFAVSAAISNVFIEHDAPLYRQGHGHLRTRVYGVTVEPGDPLPVFTDAVEITQFTGTVHAHPSNPATTWRLWIKWETVDGVLSNNPAGGTNGLAVTTGQDVTKLLDSISQAALDPDAPFSKVVFRANLFVIAPEMDFNQETTPTATAEGQLWYRPSTGVTKTWDGNSWVNFSTSAPFVVNTEPMTVNGVDVPPGVFMDAAYIKNGTITNAKIGDAAIDDAKIANLSASKIEAGSIAVGQHIQSAGYVAGSSGWRINGDGNAELSNAVVRGTVYATNGEFTGTVKAGTTILGGVATSYSSGSGFYAGLDSTVYKWRVGNPTGARIQWNGSAIEVYNASNQLTITSGGISASFVTGLGNFATLDQITSANISTYIDSAAIGTAYIADAAITTAKIGDAQVNTLQIAGNAITASSTAYVDSDSSNSGTIYSTVASYTNSLNTNITLMLLASGRTGLISGNATFGRRVWLMQGTTNIASSHATVVADTGETQWWGDFITLTALVTIPANTTVYFSMKLGNSGFNTASLSFNLNFFAAKK